LGCFFFYWLQEEKDEFGVRRRVEGLVCCVQDLNNTLMVTRDWREEITFFKHNEQNSTDKQYTNTTPVHANLSYVYAQLCKCTCL